jgi:hypothetical protein
MAEQKTVWMKCRAKPDQQIDSRAVCTGNEAVIVFQRKLPAQQGGGTVTRYRCTSCNGTWHTRL